MNFFEAFNCSKHQNTPVLKQNEKTYTIGFIKQIIMPICKNLTENACKNVVITSTNNFNFFINFIASIYSKKKIYVLSDTKKENLLNFDYIKLNDIPKTNNSENPNNFQFITPDLKTTYFTMCTSGSTGEPKFIQKNIFGLLAEVEDLAKEFNITPNTELVISTTPHHMFGMTCYIGLTLYCCGDIVADTQEILYPDQAVLQNKIFVSTPAFLEKFKKHEISLENKPKLILSAGDKIKKEIYEYFNKHNINLINIYGSTETGIIAYNTAKNTTIMQCFKSVRISNDKSAQIIIESPYFIENKVILCDIVEILSKNSFILKERNDRILKIQENRVSAKEIEDILKLTEHVEDSYCFKHEDKLACAVVLNNNTKESLRDEHLTRTELIKKLKAIIKQKSDIIPQRWKFIYEIPKTKTGKIDKNKINSYFSLNLSLPLIFDIYETENETCIDLVFLRDSNFFSGHFTNCPILPGVVQLYFAQRFARQILNKKLKTNSAKKVKFSHIIRPNQKVTLCFTINESSISYTYRSENKIYSSGILPNEKD